MQITASCLGDSMLTACTAIFAATRKFQDRGAPWAFVVYRLSRRLPLPVSDTQKVMEPNERRWNNDCDSDEHAYGWLWAKQALVSAGDLSSSTPETALSVSDATPES